MPADDRPLHQRHARAWPPRPAEVAFAPAKALWLHLHLWPVVVLGPAHLSPAAMAAGAALCAICLCLGHSVGLHRALIHQSLVLGPRTQGVLLGLAALTGVGPVLRLMDVHDQRDHWQNQPECPAYYAYQHGVLQDLWWNLHCAHHPPPGQARAPLHTADRHSADPWLAWLDRWGWALNLGLGLALLAAGGPALWIWAHCGRITASILGHWLVNFAAHRHGALDWTIDGAGEEGRNHALFGALSMGEGWHNNHHAFPHSARFGQAWWQLDPGWWAVCALRAAGCAWGVREDTGAEPRPGGKRRLAASA
ncbi:MAG: hypothetical protein RL071_4044 [Pseudomonadota bacterium]